MNPGKNKLVLFRRTKAVESELGDLILFGTILNMSATVKYLGVIFDNRISHLEHKLNKTIGIFWMCKSAFSRTWGLSQRIYPTVRDLVCYTDGSKRDGLTGAGFLQ